jgi:hypothetical protein
MSKRTFTREKLLAILYGDEGRVHLDEIKDHDRWSVRHRFVFSPEGEERYYETSYSRAATELQCGRPWEYQDTIDCMEVEPFEKIVIDYRLV